MLPSLVFAAGLPSSYALPLLGDLCEPCVKKNLQPRRGQSARGAQSRHPFSSLFPQKRENVNPIPSVTSTLFKRTYFPKVRSFNNLRTLLQNTAGATPSTQTPTHPLPSFSTPSKHATHTNTRKPNSFMGLLHSSLFHRFFRPPAISGATTSGFSLGFSSFRWDGYSYVSLSHLRDSHDRQCSVTGPFIGCVIAAPVRRDSSKFAFKPKYHFACRSASSINISRGLCFNPSACRIIVSWSCRKNFSANIRKIQTGSNKFHAATKSIRHRSRRTGVTVARLENHSFPLRISSVRIFGSTKSIVVVTGSPVYFCSMRYGALFELGVCGLIRNPFGIGSNFFPFS